MTHTHTQRTETRKRKKKGETTNELREVGLGLGEGEAEVARVEAETRDLDEDGDEAVADHRGEELGLVALPERREARDAEARAHALDARLLVRREDRARDDRVERDAVAVAHGAQQRVHRLDLVAGHRGRAVLERLRLRVARAHRREERHAETLRDARRRLAADRLVHVAVDLRPRVLRRDVRDAHQRVARTHRAHQAVHAVLAPRKKSQHTHLSLTPLTPPVAPTTKKQKHKTGKKKKEKDLI